LFIDAMEYANPTAVKWAQQLGSLLMVHSYVPARTLPTVFHGFRRPLTSIYNYVVRYTLSRSLSLDTRTNLFNCLHSCCCLFGSEGLWRTVVAVNKHWFSRS